MQVIQRQAKAARDILGFQDYDPERDKDVRFLTYCVAASCNEGILIHNVMTKELLLLESNEVSITDDSGERIPLIDTENLKDSELFKLGPGFSDVTETLYRYLFEHWYLVPKNNDDKELCLNLRAIAQHMNKINSPKGVTSYTILTTTDCNARCYYCYEAGIKRQNMSADTAHKTFDFICDNYEKVRSWYNEREKKEKEKPVQLRWFGGEPLFNMQAIDIITEGLTERGIPFSSGMISNGYLFDDDVVKKAVNRWNLKSVQITLDGTEEEYNRSKAYIYTEGSPYNRVLRNIGRLLDAGIAVSIRLNLSDENFEDLCTLVDQLADTFKGSGRFNVYARYLFDTQNGGNTFSGETETLCNQMIILNDRLISAGLSKPAKIPESIKINCCMADSDSSAVIETDGSLGKCEHYPESFLCGDIRNGITAKSVVSYWKEVQVDVPACVICPLYPDCIRLAGCPSSYANACQEVPALRQDKVVKLRQDLLNRRMAQSEKEI